MCKFVIQSSARGRVWMDGTSFDNLHDAVVYVADSSAKSVKYDRNQEHLRIIIIID